MYSYLVDHATKNVWCSPEQDNQAIFKPQKLTPSGGAIHSFDLMWKKLTTPDQSSHWHLYQVGQINPAILGLLPRNASWVSFSETSNQNKMICDIYLNSGIQIPRFDSFYMYTQERDLVIAIKRNDNIPFDFNNEDIYVRLYSNAYFDSGRATQPYDGTFTAGLNCRTTADIVNLQTQYLAYKNKPGCTYAFINGVRVKELNLLSAKVGDCVEFVYDSSVYKVVEFTVGNLLTFTSTLDSKLKYLLHYAGADTGIIDYRDDIDIFLVDKINDTTENAVFYHKNANDSFRMVTHRDYSMPTAYVVAYVDSLQAIAPVGRTVTANSLVVRLQIRMSGYYRPRVYDNNRIADLYKMNDGDIVRAMIGVDATVTNWQAAVLENSDFNKIMDAQCCDITQTLVQNAYGYNSITKVAADTPQVPYVVSGTKRIDLPYGLQNNSTVYEYNSDGFMTGWYIHNTGSTYTCADFNTVLVQVINGLGGQTLTDKRAPNNISIDTSESYRVYFNPTSSSGVYSDWTDVTGIGNYVVTTGNILNRSDNLTTGNFLVRNEKSFLAYDLEIPMTHGELRFTLSQIRTINSVPTPSTMEVPMGQIDLFLNGKLLIQDLDYHVRFPQVAICNKQYLDDPLNKAQKVHIRFVGFCNNLLQIEKPMDAGFIEHGYLSNNNKFDLRDDKVLSIDIDGALYRKEELNFSEDHSGVSVQNVLNGKPYSIQDLFVPLRALSTVPTFQMRQSAKAIDTAVSNYLSLKIPEPVRSVPNSIVSRYVLFSPFISKIIHDLSDDVLNPPNLGTNYSDNFVLAQCSSYENLLTFDPSQQNQSVNSRYVIIHPHNLNSAIGMSALKYAFLQKVVRLYTNNLITLSGFVTIT